MMLRSPRLLNTILYPPAAFQDPKVEGVTIYLADFERPINEKLAKNFFDDPTSTSLTCARGTNIKVGDISKDLQGEVRNVM
jgi:catabolite regulation protein CreA